MFPTLVFFHSTRVRLRCRCHASLSCVLGKLSEWLILCSPQLVSKSRIQYNSRKTYHMSMRSGTNPGPPQNKTLDRYRTGAGATVHTITGIRHLAAPAP